MLFQLVFLLFAYLPLVFGYEDYNARLASDMSDLLATVTETFADFDKRLEDIANHLLIQDLYTGEKLRSNGHSGIKQKRLRNSGTRNYHLASHSGTRIAGIHNHANFDRVMGIGEIVAVLNGVEFRTRHNDYMLYQPSTNSSDLHATEDVPFPGVPEAVTEKDTVEEEVIEMREWFKAWRDQNSTVRDYREFFKPVLCYLEGAWYYQDQIPVDIIHSDRHAIASPDFVHLLKEFKFSSDSGRRDDDENLAFLPRMVNRVVNGTPEFAQWNYRILCQPLANDLPLNRFRVIDEVGPRMRYRQTYEEHAVSMKARFQLNHNDTDEFGKEVNTHYEFLDSLMAQIPGLDNHGANITDEAFGTLAYEMEDDIEDVGETPLNAANYHRWFMAAKKGAFGLTTRRRGFGDNNMFVAKNTQPGVVPTEIEYCTGAGHREQCEWQEHRFSYAIPLEIVYLTPLSRWNPYNIVHKGHPQSDEGKTVRDNGRTGRPTMERAYNGTNTATYFQTPGEFYEGGEVASDPADTTGRGATCVLDAEGELRMVRDSGHRIFLPEIPNVGVLRQRYPIMPIHGEGSSVWKELEALKDIVLDYNDNAGMYRNYMPQSQDVEEEAVDTSSHGMTLLLAAGRAQHSHTIHISQEQLATLREGSSIRVTTEVTNMHSHQLTIIPRGRVDDPRYFAADVEPNEPHSSRLVMQSNAEEDVGAL